MRSLRYFAPIQVLGDEILTDENTVEEIRLVQAFIAERTQPNEPIFTAPRHSIYHLLLDRPNPTAFLGDFSFANLAMSGERKRSEMRRLLASETRYAIVEREWWANPSDPSRPILDAVHSAFVPVRLYGSMAILERDSSSKRLRMQAIARRIWRKRIAHGDALTLWEIVQERPNEPVAHQLLGELLLAQRKFPAAKSSLESALRLDPANPYLRSQLAELLDLNLR
jgi:tetratricopeptide (TPR) repeat protein